jgi:alpha-1,3-rhamnosyltransferase
MMFSSDIADGPVSQDTEKEARDHSTGRVSEVVPSYNHEAYVEQTLRSIYAQSRLPDELLVIDDGSTDGSASVIERTLRDCPVPCEMVVRENRGLSRTLNEALERTTGEYFAYLGSDDLWLRDFLKRRIEALEPRPDAVLAYGELYCINAENVIIGFPFDFYAYEHLSTRDRLLFGFAPTSSGIVYRKSFLADERWNPDIKLEDYDLYLRLCMKGEFLFDKRADAAWRLHEANTSSGYEFMMNELVDAISRNAETLQLSDELRNRVISSKKLAYVDKFLADHRRRQAMKLFWENRQAFPSRSAMLKKAIKLMTPFAINDRRTNYLLDKMTQSHEMYIDANFEVAAVEHSTQGPTRPRRHFG